MINMKYRITKKKIQQAWKKRRNVSGEIKGKGKNRENVRNGRVNLRNGRVNVRNGKVNVIKKQQQNGNNFQHKYSTLRKIFFND